MSELFLSEQILVLRGSYIRRTRGKKIPGHFFSDDSFIIYPDRDTLIHREKKYILLIQWRSTVRPNKTCRLQIWVLLTDSICGSQRKIELKTSFDKYCRYDLLGVILISLVSDTVKSVLMSDNFWSTSQIFLHQERARHISDLFFCPFILPPVANHSKYQYLFSDHIYLLFLFDILLRLFYEQRHFVYNYYAVNSTIYLSLIQHYLFDAVNSDKMYMIIILHWSFHLSLIPVTYTVRSLSICLISVS